MHWPDEFDPALWPFALNYAVEIYNNLPTKVKNGLCPNKVFAGIILGCGLLKRLRVFGCPCHVLDPRIQDGKQIPKWEPCAHAGQFLGFSKEHSSKVLLVQNLRTGQITPQFHVAFDEMFHMITTEMEINLKETWIDLFQDSSDHYLKDNNPEIDPPIPPLDEEWQFHQQSVDVPVAETVPEVQNVQPGCFKIE